MVDNPYKNVTSAVGLQDNVVSDFFAFLTKGNIMDLAIGTVLGSAFTGVATALSQDILVPIVGSLANVDMSNGFYVWKKGKTSSTYEHIIEAEKDGAVVIRYGRVFEKGVTFMTQAIVLYFMIRAYQKAKEQLNYFRSAL